MGAVRAGGGREDSRLLSSSQARPLPVQGPSWPPVSGLEPAPRAGGSCGRCRAPSRNAATFSQSSWKRAEGGRGEAPGSAPALPPRAPCSSTEPPTPPRAPWQEDVEKLQPRAAPEGYTGGGVGVVPVGVLLDTHPHTPPGEPRLRDGGGRRRLTWRMNPYCTSSAAKSLALSPVRNRDCQPHQVGLWPPAKLVQGPGLDPGSGWGALAGSRLGCQLVAFQWWACKAASLL